MSLQFNHSLPVNHRSYRAVIALAFLSALSTSAAARDNTPPAKPERKADSTANDKKAPVAIGEVVSELGKSVMYVFHAKNNDYWFGSDDRGVYRYNGKAIVNFTRKDGLVSNQIRGIQEDKSGNIYFTTYEGISKFDGKSFTTLIAPARSGGRMEETAG